MGFEMEETPDRKMYRKKISLMFRKGAVTLAYTLEIITGIETPSTTLGVYMPSRANVTI